MDKESRAKVLEVLLWMTDRPLKHADFKDILGSDCPPEAELREEVQELGRALDGRDAPVQLMEVADGFQVSSRPAFSSWIRRLYKDKTTLRLSTSALETLSIVAYKQPITRGEIEEIRGVSLSPNIIKTLMERGWVREVGTKEVPGRPALLGTTAQFLDDFNLKALDQLPSLPELKDPAQLEAALMKLGAHAPPAPPAETAPDEESTTEQPATVH